MASIGVKAPRDPDKTVDAEESDEGMDPPEGKGLDLRRSRARLRGTHGRCSRRLYDSAAPDGRRKKPADDDEMARPLIGPAAVPSRTYVGVGITTRGRNGTISKRVTVPLVSPPPAPEEPELNYNETTVTVTWAPVTLVGMVQGPTGEGLLESRPIGSFPFRRCRTTSTKWPLRRPPSRCRPS